MEKLYKVQLSAPAKINLFLRILDKRADGYHELASLMQSIDLADQLQLELAQDDRFICSDLSLQTPDNLVMKALSLFKMRTGRKFSVKCHLVKNIPSQAGLGGGSSDAAAMLKGLNQLLGYPLEEGELYPLAVELGSDVPFFMKAGSAYCEGRGEKVSPLMSLEKRALWIVKPPFGLSTLDVYKTLELKGLKKRNPKHSLQEHLLGQGEYYNDLEEAAFHVKPELREVKRHLMGRGFSAVVLAGSGSSFFCLGEGYPEMPPNYFVCQSHFL